MIRFTDSEWTRRLWCGRIRLRVPVGPPSLPLDSESESGVGIGGAA